MAKKIISSRYSKMEAQRTLLEKLKHVTLDDLNQMCTFSDGGFSHVSLVQLADHPDSAFALKTMQKATIQRPSSRKQVMTEKKLLSEIQSDFVVKFYRTFKDKKYLHFLTEYCPGGDLDDLDPLSEDVARFYMACVVEALNCLHSRNIVHNDLKPENLVVDAEGYVKVIDMGLARHLKRGLFVRDASGTMDFLPPEVIWSRLNPGQRPMGRDRAVDLWALGVILYEFLRGESPFDDGNNNMKMKNIMRGMDSVDFPKKYFSDEAENLIRKLCSYKLTSRLGYGSIEEIRQHPWFDNFNWDSLRKRELQPPRVPQVVSAVDTGNFNSNFQITPDSDVKEDESDWDADF